MGCRRRMSDNRAHLAGIASRGRALATWSSAGLAFFVYAAANLGPRALSYP